MKYSKHSIERIKETPIKVNWAKKMAVIASDMQLKKRIEAWKFAKYGMKQMNLSYKKTTIEVIFAINKEKNELITVTVKNKNTGEVYGKDLLL